MDMNKLYTVIHDTLFTRDQTAAYSRLLSTALAEGYSFLILSEYHDMMTGNQLLPEKMIVLRHDIDTDPRGALSFFAVERSFGIRASYFFRLRTWDQQVIDILRSKGMEIGYHYEELATFAKANRIKDKETVLRSLTAIREIFRQNLNHLRRNNDIVSFASHGDFTNRVLGQSNCIILDDPELRVELRVKYEAYDPVIKNGEIKHISDKGYPLHYYPEEPFSLINRGESFIFLTHPRWWRKNLQANIKELMIRMYEGVTW